MSMTSRLAWLLGLLAFPAVCASLASAQSVGVAGQNSDKGVGFNPQGALGSPDNDVTKALNDAITQKSFVKPPTTSSGPNTYP